MTSRGPHSKGRASRCIGISYKCGEHTDTEEGSGRILKGRLLPDGVFKDHQRRDKLLRAWPQDQQPGDTDIPDASQPGTSISAPSHVTSSSYAVSVAERALGASPEDSSSLATEMKSAGAKKLVSQIGKILNKIEGLRELFLRDLQPDVSAESLVFEAPPVSSDQVPPQELADSVAEVNQRPYRLTFGLPNNIPILQYEEVVMHHLIAVKSVMTKDTDAENSSKDSLLVEILAEWDRVQARKKFGWLRQRDHLHDAPLEPLLQENRNVISTAEWRRSSSGSIHAIPLAIYLITAVLHLICGLSLRDCGFLLSGFREVAALCLSCFSASTLEAESIINSIPQDARTVVKRLNLHINAKRFVCCPKCFALHPVNSCPRICTHLETPSSTPCSAHLWRDHVIQGKPFTHPIRTFEYHDMKKWVGEFLCRPDIEKLVDRDVFEKYSVNDADMHDVWDGEVLRNFKGPDGKPFVAKHGDEGRYLFSLAMDGFNPRGTKAAGKRVSTGGIYLVCLNLPREYRYQLENMFPVGVIPGPSEPSLHEINHLIRPLVDDLVEFWDPGVWYTSTPNFPDGRRVRCAVVPLACDLPAARQMAGFASFGTLKFFCSFCRLHLHDIKNFDRASWGSRSWEEHLKWARAWRDAKSEAEREEIFQQHGVRWSELLRLPYWNPVLFTLLDTMHALFLGNFKRHCRSIWGMDVKFHDGDGISDERANDADVVDEAELIQARIKLRTGSKKALGQFRLPVLRALMASIPQLAYQNDKKQIMKSLGDYRIASGWFSPQGRLLMPPQPDELPAVSGTHIDPESITNERLDAAREFLLCAPVNQSLEKLRKDDLLALCLDRIPRARTELARMTKKQLAQALGDWRVQQGLLNASGRLQVHDSERYTAATIAYKTQGKTKVLGQDRLRAVWEDMEKTMLPTWLPAAPFHIGDGRHGKITADQWRTFCTTHLVITLCRIWGHLDKTNRFRQFLDNFMDLVTATKLATRRAISPETIRQFDLHYMRYLSQLVVLFPDIKLTPTQHISAHLTDQLRMFGPAHSVWTFPFERVNHVLQQINKNNRLGDMEKTMFERFVMSQKLRNLFSSCSLPDTMKRIVTSFSKTYDLSAHGTLLNDILSFEAESSRSAASEQRTGRRFTEDPSSMSEHPQNSIGKEVTLDPKIFAVLEDYYRLNFNIVTPGQFTRRKAILHTKLSWQGVSFSPHSSSPRDSHVIVGSSVPQQWEAARIYAIVRHAFNGNYESSTCQTFFIVQKFNRLRVPDAPHDCYSHYPYAGGRLYYADVAEALEVVPMDDVLCHFALTPIRPKGVLRECIHALPLDRVRA